MFRKKTQKLVADIARGDIVKIGGVKYNVEGNETDSFRLYTNHLRLSRLRNSPDFDRIVTMQIPSYHELTTLKK